MSREAPPRAPLDDVSELLHEVVWWLERGRERRDEPLISQRAQRHAMTRFDRHVDFREMIDEYRVLRRVLLRRVLQRLGELDRVDEIIRLNEAVDVIAAEAAGRFVRAREDLRMAEDDRARLAVDAAEIGTWEWLPRTGALFWDDRCRKILGVPEGPVNYETLLALTHPEDRGRVVEQISQNLEREDSYQIEYRIRRGSDGALRYVEGRGHVLSRDSSGRAERFVGTVLDVTRRHEADEFRERFIGIVSHDLRSPLSTIRMCAGAIRNAAGLPDAVVKHVGRIESNIVRMDRMISDLLDLTRGRLGGGIPIARGSCNLDAIASGVIEAIEAAHPDRCISKKVTGCLDGCWDRDRLTQLLDNLLGNAIKYGDPEEAVRVCMRGTDGQVTLDVHNQGVPIDPDLMPGLFDAFRRAGAGDRPRDGLGLGLYIVREIVRAHGGRIWASSSAQEGTTFAVTLPR